VEKWKTDLNVEIIENIRPQPLWKTCGKLLPLWKIQTLIHFFHSFHRADFSPACGKVENFV